MTEAATVKTYHILGDKLEPILRVLNVERVMADVLARVGLIDRRPINAVDVALERCESILLTAVVLARHVGPVMLVLELLGLANRLAKNPVWSLDREVLIEHEDVEDLGLRGAKRHVRRCIGWDCTLVTHLIRILDGDHVALADDPPLGFALLDLGNQPECRPVLLE